MLSVGSPLVLAPAPTVLSAPSIGMPCSSTSPDPLRRAAPRSARLRRLNKPSSPCVGEGVAPAERLDFPREGVRSFHAATILRTEVRGERGDV